MTCRQRVLELLEGSPGLTGREMRHALGVTSAAMYSLLGNMEAKAQLVCSVRREPGQGQALKVWSIAPPGTVPPAPLAPSAETTIRRRQAARDAARRRRARAKGAVIPPGGPVPSDLPALLAVPVPAVPVPRHGACAAVGPELWFPPDGEQPAAREARLARAVMICHSCPVQAQCYTAAVANGEAWGIWGGVDFTARPGPDGRRRAS